MAQPLLASHGDRAIEIRLAFIGCGARHHRPLLHQMHIVVDETLTDAKLKTCHYPPHYRAFSLLDNKSRMEATMAVDKLFGPEEPSNIELCPKRKVGQAQSSQRQQGGGGKDRSWRIRGASATRVTWQQGLSAGNGRLDIWKAREHNKKGQVRHQDIALTSWSRDTPTLYSTAKAQRQQMFIGLSQLWNVSKYRYSETPKP